MRLFVSVDLRSLAEEIHRVQERLTVADGIRLTDPAQTHLTLKFLGETEEHRLAEVTEVIEDAVENSEVGPFDAECGGLGVFPDVEYIRVVWVGFREGSNELERLQDVVEDATTAIGFDAEEHEFTPHATIARMDHAGGKELVQEVVRSRDPTVGTVTVTEVLLMESSLTSDGPVYSTVERFPLPK